MGAKTVYKENKPPDSGNYTGKELNRAVRTPTTSLI